MSDQHNHNEQEEFEAMFSSTEQRRDDAPVQEEQATVHPESTVEDHEVIDAGEVHEGELDDLSGMDDTLADFSDIDDGVDEDGIFAASSEKRKTRKKSSSPAMMALIAMLAVGGAGGYFYYTNPEIINQIKENFAGEGGASSLLSGLSVLGDDAKSVISGSGAASKDAQDGGVIGGVVASDLNDMPPQPEPVDVAQAADVPLPGVVAPDNVVLSPEAPLVDSAAPSMSGDMPPPPATAGVPVEEVNSSSSAPVPASSTEPLPEAKSLPQEEPKSQPSEDQVAQVAPPAPIETPVETPAAAPTKTPVEAPSETVTSAPAEPAATNVPEPTPAKADVPAAVDQAPVVAQAEAVDTPAAPEGNAKIIRPTEKIDHNVKLVDDLTPQEKPDAAGLQKAPVEKASNESKNDSAKVDDVAEKDKFFDAPPGKILATVPAPSMDVKRGKYESIIVVESPAKPPKKSSSKSSSKLSHKADIQMTSLDDRVVAASRALKLGRYDAARDMYDELYSLNPRDPRVLMGRAILFQKTGEPDRAISTYEELLDVAPDNAEAIVNMAGLVRKEHPAMALSKLLDMRQQYPDNAAIAAQLGVAYADSGNLQDAYRYLDLAASMEPNNPQHYFNMAIIAERARDIPKAISMYEKALEVDAIHGDASTINRDVIYDRLAKLR